MRPSKTMLLLIGLGAVAAAALAAGAGSADEQKVTLDQVPPAVKAAILKEAAGAEITEVERETKNGKTVYEAEFLRGGQEIEIKVAPDGTVLAREVEDEGDDEDEIGLDQIPARARKALEQLAGGAKILKAQQGKEHGAVVFEAEWSANGVEHEAAVTADGALLETEQTVAAERVPAAVRAAIGKHYGVDAKVVIEKKTIIVYEAEARIDGKEKELLIFPTGRVHEEHDDHDDDHDHD